jgi:alkanesulfonate monooxygenase SsuD/methylene tetrahydromethanopterin reductase-like flavin-dependent oxidoreductase (luciferase family)
MEFGVFNLMQQRRLTKPAHQIIAETVEQTRLADELGYATAWYAEHHFSNYSLCPSPLMMAAHVAAVTKRIRVGTAVVVAPLYTPARLLAEIGFVDNLSNGRLDLGLGNGYQGYEFERFGVSLGEAKVRTLEIIDQIELGLANPHFEYSGEYYDQPRTAINNRPLQSPTPPIWIASGDPDLIRRAIRRDYTIFISGVLGGWKRLAGMREMIDKIAVEEGRNPDDVKVALLRFAFPSRSRKDVADYVDCALYQQRLAVALKTRQEKLVDNYMVEEKPYPEELPPEKILMNLPVGDVETCAERMVREIEHVRPTHVAIQPQIGDMEHAKAMQALELWSSEVIPAISRALKSNAVGPASLAQAV